MAQQGQYAMNPIHHQTVQAYHPQPQYPPPIQPPPQPISLPYPPHQYQYPPPPHHHPHHQALPPPHQQLQPLPQYQTLHHQSHQPTYSQAQLQQAQYQAQAQLRAHAQAYTERPSAKRPREPPTETTAGEDAGDDPLPKRKKGQDVLFRIVVPSRQIGKVIGKEGHRIQKIREATRATIKIADAITRYEERVIIISSKDNDDGVTDAEQALHQIAVLILAEDNVPVDAINYSADAAVGGASTIGSVGGISITGSVGTINGASAAHSTANSIKLLIAGSQAGSLIGVSGQNIEKLRNSSGATITVLAPNQLPFCASAHESDRLVQISGEVSSILKAVEEIGSQLRENPPKQVISISPTYNFSTTRTAQQYLDPTAAEYITLDILVPETMVGGLIGRCGSNISRIRSESGAMIKVYGGKGEQKHRPIQLAGTAQQVALAKQRVDEYVYAQLVQQTGSQQ
ncbi:hypothetical protein Ancab_037217 [Ancistrocladus abbreviatus]